MSKAAVIFAPGFEEIEGLTIVDVLRRAEVDVTMLGLEAEVTGNHDITIKVDEVLSSPLEGYDLIALPGGMPGAANLRDNELVIQSLQNQQDGGREIGAVCAAPIVLEEAGILKDKEFTSFPGFEEDIQSGTHSDDIVVVDGKVVTSRGPATALAFAYQLLEQLGIDSEDLKENMQFNKLIDSFKEN